MKSKKINKRILLTNSGTSVAHNIIKYNINNIEKIYGTDINKFCYAAKVLKNNFFITPPFKKWDLYKKTLLKICKKNKIDLIISCSNDTELVRITKDRKYFEENGIKILTSNYNSIKICDDKIKCNKFVSNLNIKVPATYLPKNLPSKINFPLILKNRKGSGSQNIEIINNNKDLLYYKYKYKNIIFQKLIKGQEYSIDLVLNNNSDVIVASCRKRLATKGGICTKTEIVDKKELIEKSSIIAKKLKLIGGINIQFMDDYFIEVNPRLPGGIGLITKAGFNMSLLAIKSFFDLPIQNSEKLFKKLKVFRVWEDISYYD